jgi:hypothetical protein
MSAGALCMPQFAQVKVERGDGNIVKSAGAAMGVA